ncbi:MAG: Hsp70 family protein [bacterium]|nr:Hsp70 family protein [bacterium]
MRVGIDLGTTFSAIAYINPKTNKPEIIKNRNGNRMTPSVLAFIKDTCYYGDEAKEYQEHGYPDVVSYFKRNMGNEEYVYCTGDHMYTATDLSELLLKNMLAEASEAIGEPITEAVITVPAYFRHKERKATMEAATRAGVKVLHVINEPTAAAYAYGLNGSTSDKTVLIYDLGGGTFDVSIAKITGEDIRILGSDGNHELGGKEWDDILARYLNEQFYEEFGIEISNDLAEANHLLAIAENLKKRLSVANSAECSITYKGRTGHYRITEQMFEKLSNNMLQITNQVITRLLFSVGMDRNQIDGILLVGGSTRMQMVRNYVTRLIKKPLLNGVNVDEAVAMGAAMKACMDGEQLDALLPDLGKEEKEKREYEFKLPGAKRLAETIAHSLGMISVSEDGNWYVNSVIIKKNTPIPACNTRSYRLKTTLGDNELFVYLVQGEKGNPLDCEIVGKYVFHGIEHTETCEATLLVTYSYNEDGMIEVSAMQQETGNVLPLTIEPVDEDMSWVREVPNVNQNAKKELPKGTLYLAVDLSGSMSGYPLLEAKKAIESFILKLDLTKLAVGIIGFADRTSVILKPTKDLYRIEQALANMRVDGVKFGYGNTATPFSKVYEDIIKRRSERREEQEKEYIVLLTDGEWTYKENAIKEAKKCLKEQVEIVALGFGSADEAFLNTLVSKKELADVTNLANLTQSFTKIAQIMTS